MTAEDGFVPTPTAVADQIAVRLLAVGDTDGASLLYPGAGRGSLYGGVQRVCHVRDKPLPACVAVEKSSQRVEHLTRRFDEYQDQAIAPTISDGSRRAIKPTYPPSAGSHERELNPSVDIHRSNFLTTSFDRKFDFVIGNPPYTRYRELDTDAREEYGRRFSAAADSFSLAAPFVEHALNQLKNGGHFGFIVPESVLNKRYMSPLRKRLREERITEVVALPDDSFPDHTIKTVAIFGKATGTPTRNGHFWVEPLFNWKTDTETFLSRLGVPEHELEEAVDRYSERVEGLQNQLRTLRSREGKEGGYNVNRIPSESRTEEQSGIGEWTA